MGIPFTIELAELSSELVSAFRINYHSHMIKPVLGRGLRNEAGVEPTLRFAILSYNIKLVIRPWLS